MKSRSKQMVAQKLALMGAFLVLEAHVQATPFPCDGKFIDCRLSDPDSDCVCPGHGADSGPSAAGEFEVVYQDEQRGWEAIGFCYGGIDGRKQAQESLQQKANLSCSSSQMAVLRTISSFQLNCQNNVNTGTRYSARMVGTFECVSQP